MAAAPPKRALQVKVMIVRAVNSAIIPETVSGVSECVDAPYKEIRLRRSGHWVQQESAAKVNSALRSFLAEQK